ncbi:pilus assembly protein TadG-related protein [Methylopila musalis]|uniref:Pilus assembly protein TadG-related protein n=1 Tax=Methylopila musalis TaxID=1134781 RepID=A0ABW3ZB26_9HYPH
MRAAARGLARLRRDERGSVAIMTALFGFCAIGCLALGVDLASLYGERRRLQGVADLAAIAAANDLANAERAARATAADNGVTNPKRFVLTLGRYTPDPAVPAARRFTPNATPFNAARVAINADAPLVFGRALLGRSAVEVGVEGSAANTQLASFFVGSRLASLNGGVANVLLSALTGGSVSLSVMDYNALAAAKVEALPFLDALATRLRLTAGTYESLLDANASVGQVVAAMADVSQGGAQARAALGQIAAQATAAGSLRVGDVVGVGPYAKAAIGRSGSALSAAVSAFDLMMATLETANGKRQLDLNLGLQVPGLAGVRASLVIGERPQSAPWLALGAEGAIVRTAQTRLRVTAEVGTSPLLKSLTGGLALVELPLAIDLAAAEAKLDKLSCGAQPAQDARVTVQVRPAVTQLWVGKPASVSLWNDMSKTPAIEPASINLLLATATASAYVAATNVNATPLTFTAAEIRNHTLKSAKTGDAAQTTLASLTQNLTLNVKLLGLIDLGLGQLLGAALKPLLVPVGALLDPVVNALLELLGVKIGEADVGVRGVRCDGAALVG